MATNEFIYCPYCATLLEDRFISGQMRRVCPKGDFVQFHDPKVAVIALVLHQDRLLLARRAVEPEKGKWALPGGYMDAGEMPEEALQRELIEEVNLAIHVQKLLTIYPMGNPNRGDVGDDTRTDKTVAKRGIVLAYQATVSATDERAAPPALEAHDDIDEARWFAAEQLPAEIAFESTRTLLTMWQQGKIR